MMFMFRYIIMLLMLSTTVFFYQGEAVAADATSADITQFSPQTYICAAEPGEYTQAIVKCIQTPVRNAVLKPNDGLLAMMSKYMVSFLSPLFAVALIWLGVRAATGESSVFPRAMGLALRVGIVTASFYLIEKFIPAFYTDKYSPILFQTLDGSFIGKLNPWLEVDKVISRILGFADQSSSIKDGLIGLIDGSFFSKNFGIMLSVVGCFAIFSLLMLAVQILYVYLSSVILIGFLIITLPIFIPFIVFTYTETYLAKWFNILLSSLLTPTLMFFFLALFMVTIPASGSDPERKGIFISIVDDIFATLPPDYLDASLHRSMPLNRAILYPSDSEQYNFLACIGQSLGTCPDRYKFNSSTQYNINPNVSKGMNSNILRINKLDFGKKDDEIKKSLLKSLLELLMFAIILNLGVKLIPSISKDIAGGATAGLEGLASPLTRAIKSMRQ